MASEERLIYANEALQMIKHSKADNPYSGTLAEPAWKLAHDCAMSCIEACATANAVEVVHGRWILLGEFCDGSVCTKCSVCGEEYTYKKGKFEFINAHYAEYNYCPNCGARMDIQ